MPDRIKAGDAVWDVRIPWYPERCTVVAVEAEGAVVEFAVARRWPVEDRKRWRVLLADLKPVSAVDLLGEITNG